MKNLVYELAATKKEAQELARLGFGYDNIEDARIALSDPKIDNYYKGLLKIYEIEL